MTDSRSVAGESQGSVIQGPSDGMGVRSRGSDAEVPRAGIGGGAALRAAAIGTGKSHRRWFGLRSGARELRHDTVNQSLEVRDRCIVARLFTRKRAGEVGRYIATGVLGVSVQVGLTVLLTRYFGLNYLVSLAVVAVSVIVVGFLLNRSWTFRKRGRNVLAELGRYLLVTGVNTFIGLASCAFLVQDGGVAYPYAIAIVAAVFAPITYLVHRAWTFGLSWLREN